MKPIDSTHILKFTTDNVIPSMSRRWMRQHFAMLAAEETLSISARDEYMRRAFDAGDDEIDILRNPEKDSPYYLSLEYQYKEAYIAAERYYHTHFDDNHTRINIHDGFDETIMIRYGRVWLLLLTLHDHENGNDDPGGPTFDDQIDHAFKATFDDVLEAMYG